MSKIAGMFGAGQDHPAPPTVQETGLPPAPTATSGSAPEPQSPTAAPPPEPPKKKRGFWSRLFGIGKDDDHKNEEQQSEEHKKKRPE